MARPGVLARLMVTIRGHRRTGRLSVDAEGARTFVYFQDGVPVFAEEGTLGETLGRLLVRLKLITREQYLVVLSRMTDALVTNEQIRFGETAVELGYLSEEQVRDALVNQVRWKIVRCFQRDDATWSFDDGASYLDDIPCFPMAIEGLVFDAVTWLDHERRLEMGLGRALTKYVHVPASERLGLSIALGLDGSPAAALSSLDGEHTCEALIASPPSSGFPMEEVLTVLVLLGVGTLHDEPSPAPAPPPAPEVAQVTPAEVPSPPSRAPRSKPPDINRTRTSQVLARIDPAVKATKAADADLYRTPNSEHEARLLAEQAFQRGRDHLRAGRGPQAVLIFKRAVALASDNQEYALMAQWCELRDRAAGEPELATQLKRTAVLALRLDPNLAFGHFVVGFVTFTAKDYQTAQRFMSRALAIDPSLTDAERYLRLIQQRLKS